MRAGTKSGPVALVTFMSFSNLHMPSGETCMFWTSGKGDSPICGRLSRSSVVKTDLNWEFKMLALPWLSVTVLLLCVSGEIPLVLSCRFTLMVSPKLLVLFILWISEHTLSVGPIGSPDLLLHSFPERLEIIPVWNSICLFCFIVQSCLFPNHALKGWRDPGLICTWSGKLTRNIPIHSLQNEIFQQYPVVITRVIWTITKEVFMEVQYVSSYPLHVTFAIHKNLPWCSLVVDTWFQIDLTNSAFVITDTINDISNCNRVWMRC